MIFDESGCLPSYELLGLSRLECNVDAIVVVGDKHQLPPYNPASNLRKRRTAYSRKSQLRSTPQNKGKLKSLLDVSKVKETKLTTQYRVPRDIADILNTRIYDGNYQTPLDIGVLDKGLTLLMLRIAIVWNQRSMSVCQKLKQLRD